MPTMALPYLFKQVFTTRFGKKDMPTNNTCLQLAYEQMEKT